MPNITSSEAFKFLNESIRPGCNRLGKMYYLVDAARDRWAGLSGTTAQKKAIMVQDIHDAADAARDAFRWTFDREQLWFLGVNTIITDTADLIADGRTDVIPVTGSQANRGIDRFRQFNNEMRTGDFDSFAAGNYATFNQVLVVCTDGPLAFLDSDVVNFINLCSTIANRYEANVNAELNTLIALAPNLH
jgi:hypothetical protein